MTLPRYPKYKESGVDWLETVPEHWTTTPLKHIADFINGAAFKPEEWGESGIPIVRIQNLNGGDDFNYFDGEIEERYLVRDGDLLFGWSGNRGTSFGPFLWRRNEVCALNQHIFRVVPHALDRRSLFWILKAVTFHVEDQAHGIIGMVHVTKGDLGAISVPIPPPLEGAQIADFLDRETERIDALVEEQKRLIELLNEKRQAVISHAVTKGLNPHAPMKDSGIEWLGEVPAHWQVLPLKRDIDFITSGSRGWASNYSDSGALFIRIANLTRDMLRVDLSDVQRVSVPDDAEGTRTKVQSGDVLFSITAYLGSVAVVPETLEDAYVSQHVALVRLRGNLLIPKWLGFVALSVAGKTWFDTQSYGGTKIQLSLDDIRDFPVLVPPLQEQIAIGRFIENSLSQLDALLEQSRLAIDLLEERRTALISAAVTGQIDIRQLADKQAAA